MTICNVNRLKLLAVLVLAVAPLLFAEEPPSEWKEYVNPLVGIRMTVNRSWTEIAVKENSQEGSVAFNVTRAHPPAQIRVMRQKIAEPFPAWMSAEILSQIYEPGYQKTGPVMFAGRSSIKITGQNKQRRIDTEREETYYSSQPPFLDQITFAAPDDEQWQEAKENFDGLRKSLKWIR
jgi:hypothetical protein